MLKSGKLTIEEVAEYSGLSVDEAELDASLGYTKNQKGDQKLEK